MKKTNLTIPVESLIHAQLKDKSLVHVYPKAIVVMDMEMTALEVIDTILSLEDATKRLYQTLFAQFANDDDDCDNCTFCEEFMEDSVKIPAWAMEAAGLDPDTKLGIIAEEDSERIVLEPLDCEHDLSDVPLETQHKLRDMGVCLGELNESIMREELVYGT